MHDKLSYSNVRLRALEPEDAEMMYEAENDPDAWRYSDYLAPLSRELLRQYAFSYDADPMRSGQLRMIIDEDGKTVGIFDLFDISPRHLRADTGIYILPQFRGKKLGIKALLLAKEYCRIRLGLHQLTATVVPENISALRCYEKSGFSISGRRPDWLRTPDSYEDALLLYCLLDPTTQ